MTDLHINPEEQRADFVLPEGCPACSGPIEVRLSAQAGARAYCAHCHWLLRPHLDVSGQSLTLGFAAAVA